MVRFKWYRINIRIMEKKMLMVHTGFDLFPSAFLWLQFFQMFFFVAEKA
jgi:hypothetical protein